VDRRKLDNVLFLDTVPKEEVTRFWSLIDISIIHLKKDPLFTSVIPSKLFECMAMGIPVLIGVEGESARIVEKERVWLVFEPENATALAEKILMLGRDISLRKSFGERGIQAAQLYQRKTLAAAMLKVLERLTDREGGVRAAPRTGKSES